MRFVFYFGWCLLGAVISEVLYDAEENGIAVAPRSEKETAGKESHECLCIRDAQTYGLEIKQAQELTSDTP